MRYAHAVTSGVSAAERVTTTGDMLIGINFYYIDRQTDRQTDGETERQTDRENS